MFSAFAQQLLSAGAAHRAGGTPKDRLVFRREIFSALPGFWIADHGPDFHLLELRDLAQGEIAFVGAQFLAQLREVLLATDFAQSLDRFGHALAERFGVTRVSRAHFG